MGAFKVKYNKVRRHIQNLTIILCSLILLQAGLNMATSVRSTKLYKTPAYSSNEVLKSEFEKEKKKLGLEHLCINIEIVDNPKFIGQCVPKDPNNYTIRIGKNYRTRGVLRHELYHLYRIHNGYFNKMRDSRHPLMTYEEWIATSYGLKED